MRNSFGWLVGATMVAGAAAASQAQTVLKVVPQSDLRVLDPIFGGGTIIRNHGAMIYDQLFALDLNLAPQPQMAESFTQSADKLTYTFKLRPGLAFSDGDPVRPEDVIQSLERWSKRDIMGIALYAKVASVAKVDDRSFRMTLKEPYGQVFESLARMNSNMPFIMKEQVAKTDAFQQIQVHIGSGPFVFQEKEWVPGSKVVYTKNTKYVPRAEPASFGAGGKVVKVDRVEWLIMPDAATTAAALQAGEVDYWETPAVDLVPVLKRNPNVVVVSTDPWGLQTMIRPNHIHPPFIHPKARQALLWAVDQEEYLRAAAGSDPQFWKVCPAAFVCGTPFESDIGAEAVREKDPAKRIAMGKRLLEESGYKGDPIVVLDPTDFPMFHAAALLTAENLRKIGAKVDIQAIDWATMLQRRTKKDAPNAGGWNIFFTSENGFQAATPWATAAATDCDKAWHGWPCDDEIQKLRAAWIAEPDLEKQKAIVVQLQKRQYEVLPFISFGQVFQPIAYRANLEGVMRSPSSFYWNIAKK